MKLRNILLTVATMLFVGQANAIELKFKFDVYSSGPTLYACNAGIKHSDPGNQVCYIQGTTQSCVPTKCEPGNPCIPKCLCTSTNGGAYRMDFMKALWGAWDGVSPLPNSVTKEAGTSNYNTIFSDTDAWGKRIEELTFNLGSERYGAKYFVDICFMGSQIEYFLNGVNAPNAIYTESSVTDMSTGLSYKTLAGLAVRSEFVCDLQGAGNYTRAANLTGQYDTYFNEANFGGGDISGSTGSTVFGANAVTLFNQNINTGANAPRFCKVRYYYDETAVNNIRKWQRHDAKVCTFTRIEEDLQ